MNGECVGRSSWQCNRCAAVVRVTSVLIAVAVAVGFAPVTAGAQTFRYRKVYDFGSSADLGTFPSAGVTVDAHGNIFGTTEYGGVSNDGVVYELAALPDGGYGYHRLHSFNIANRGGAYPTAAPVLDTSGNLYGTTKYGGGSDAGVVYELVANSTGGYSFKILRDFSGNDGAYPEAGLTLDGSGDLYGTTLNGGQYGCGVVFEMAAAEGGAFTFRRLYSFNGSQGRYPLAGLVLDGKGDLFGACWAGGNSNGGVLFELVPRGSSTYGYRVLHTFNAANSGGFNPDTVLAMDTNGDLFGATLDGGDFGPDNDEDSPGTAFELEAQSGGEYTYHTLHSFNSTDGYHPIAGMAIDTDGNVFGSTNQGGNFNLGAVFEMVADGVGGYTFRKLHSFSGPDGDTPQSGTLAVDARGNVYGTAQGGGAYSYGVIFEMERVTP